MGRLITETMIEPASTEWATAIVLTSKKDGSTPFCDNYWKLNALIICHWYPLPRVDGCTNSFGEEAVFSVLHTNIEYWQIQPDRYDCHKTVFSTQHGLYRLTKMPVALRSASVTVQRAWDTLLPSLPWQAAFVYLDDSLVFSKSSRNIIVRVWHNFLILYEAGVTVELKNCK